MQVDYFAREIDYDHSQLEDICKVSSPIDKSIIFN